MRSALRQSKPDARIKIEPYLRMIKSRDDLVEIAQSAGHPAPEPAANQPYTAAMAQMNFHVDEAKKEPWHAESIACG